MLKWSLDPSKSHAEILRFCSVHSARIRADNICVLNVHTIVLFSCKIWHSWADDEIVHVKEQLHMEVLVCEI